jgi:hypothetical protein
LFIDLLSVGLGLKVVDGGCAVGLVVGKEKTEEDERLSKRGVGFVGSFSGICPTYWQFTGICSEAPVKIFLKS